MIYDSAYTCNGAYANTGNLGVLNMLNYGQNTIHFNIIYFTFYKNTFKYIVV